MAYAGDLKSLALTGVRVRIPPRAPNTIGIVAFKNPFFAASRASRNLSGELAHQLFSRKRKSFAERMRKVI